MIDLRKLARIARSSELHDLKVGLTPDEVDSIADEIESLRAALKPFVDAYARSGRSAVYASAFLHPDAWEPAAQALQTKGSDPKEGFHRDACDPYRDYLDETGKIPEQTIDFQEDTESVTVRLADGPSDLELGDFDVTVKDTSPEKAFHNPVKDNNYDYCEKCGEFCSEHYELCICCKQPALTEKDSG
jgi:hypothetical protein